MPAFTMKVMMFKNFCVMTQTAMSEGGAYTWDVVLYIRVFRASDAKIETETAHA